MVKKQLTSFIDSFTNQYSTEGLRALIRLIIVVICCLPIGLTEYTLAVIQNNGTTIPYNLRILSSIVSIGVLSISLIVSIRAIRLIYRQGKKTPML